MMNQFLNVKSSKSFEDNETIKRIIDVLMLKIRPAVARDGDIKFESFENGIVKLNLRQLFKIASSLMTLKQGVQNLLKRYVKEVNSVGQ